MIKYNERIVLRSFEILSTRVEGYVAKYAKFVCLGWLNNGLFAGVTYLHARRPFSVAMKPIT